MRLSAGDSASSGINAAGFAEAGLGGEMSTSSSTLTTRRVRLPYVEILRVLSPSMPPMERKRKEEEVQRSDSDPTSHVISKLHLSRNVHGIFRHCRNTG